MGTQGLKMDFPIANTLAKSFISYVNEFYGTFLNKKVNVVVAGSIRRKKANGIGDIDLIVCSDSKEFNSKFLDKLEKDYKVTSAGSRTVHLLDKGYQVDLYSCDESEYIPMLNFLTGSQWHNIKLPF